MVNKKKLNHHIIGVGGYILNLDKLLEKIGGRYIDHGSDWGLFHLDQINKLAYVLYNPYNLFSVFGKIKNDAIIGICDLNSNTKLINTIARYEIFCTNEISLENPPYVGTNILGSRATFDVLIVPEKNLLPV